MAEQVSGDAAAAVRRFAFDWLEDIKQRRVEDGDLDADFDVLPD